MKQVKYDLVLIGATGFTGKLVAEYLAKEYGVKNENFVWAIAGRSQNKLNDLKNYLKDIDPEAQDIPALLADNHDRNSLDRITSVTRVIISTVGPYLKYGKKLVESCASNGTDYCDLTGEVPFIRESIDSYNTIAQKSNCRIIHSCGFDSIPSDLGVFMLQKEAIKRYGKPFNRVRLYARSMKGGLSGGTIASMIKISDYVRSKPELSGLLGNPHALNPDPQIFKGVDEPSLRSVKWDKNMNLWIYPFIMSGINTRIVRRSNALMDFLYGRSFKYSEVSSYSEGVFGYFRSILMLMGLALLKVGISFKTSLWFLKKFILPKPGQGPNRDKRENGFFSLLLVGSNKGNKITLSIKGNKDPGYAATARMITESALSLILNCDSLPYASGVLTPASGIGEVLVLRLKNKGITFTLE